MHARKIIPQIFPFLFVFLVLSAPGVAAPVLDPRLKPALGAPGGGPISVIVTLAPRAAPEQITEPNKQRRRALLLDRMHKHAALDRAPLEAWLRARGATSIRPLWIANAVACSAPPAVVRALADFPGVVSVRPDAVVHAPAPPPVSLAKPHGAVSGSVEWNIAAIKAPEMWAMGLTGQGVVVATLDTGVDYRHADLAGRWRGGANSWYDPHGQHATPYDAHEIGHGTGVMGLILGGSATGTAIGVAPGARWIAAKAFNDDGIAPNSIIHVAFQWVLDPDGNPATNDAPDIVNNSWGFDDRLNQVEPEFLPDIQALQAAGILVIAAAGNSGPDPSSSMSPANYTGVFAVGGVRFFNGAYPIFDGSSRGPAPGGGLYPLLTMPGEGVKTCDLTLGVQPAASATRVGTSFAAPHLSGAAALLLQAFPAATRAQIELALVRSATDLGEAGADNTYGHGLVNVRKAYDELRRILQTAASPAWLNVP